MLSPVDSARLGVHIFSLPGAVSIHVSSETLRENTMISFESAWDQGKLRRKTSSKLTQL
jgi:hypothetical protein